MVNENAQISMVNGITTREESGIRTNGPGISFFLSLAWFRARQSHNYKVGSRKFLENKAASSFLILRLE